MASEQAVWIVLVWSVECGVAWRGVVWCGLPSQPNHHASSCQAAFVQSVIVEDALSVGRPSVVGPAL